MTTQIYEMSISYLLNPETTICDLPLEITEKITDMVAELHLQDHKKKFQDALHTVPFVAKVLWFWSCETYDGPIKIECQHPDSPDDDDWRLDEAENFMLEVHTNLNYYNIRHELTKSTYYHERQDAMTPRGL